MRSCKPDPLAADIVHMREGGRNAADFGGRFGCGFRCPGGRIKVFDQDLIDVVVDEKNLGGRVLDCYSAAFSVRGRLAIDGSTLGHGFVVLDLVIRIVSFEGLLFH
jgi:hypothetical protein